MCGRLCSYPSGFELDHIIAIEAKGTRGEDTEDNVQVLCSGPNGCHAKKTAKDMGYKFRPTIGADGYPVG